MSAHTPGPWEVIGGAVYTATEHIGTAARIASMDREELRTKPVERDANAHLIAAAPDLLEALKLSLAWFLAADCAATPGGRKDLATIRAALAKARGDK